MITLFIIKLRKILGKGVEGYFLFSIKYWNKDAFHFVTWGQGGERGGGYRAGEERGRGYSAGEEVSKFVLLLERGLYRTVSLICTVIARAQ